MILIHFILELYQSRVREKNSSGAANIHKSKAKLNNAIDQYDFDNHSDLNETIADANTIELKNFISQIKDTVDMMTAQLDMFKAKISQESRTVEQLTNRTAEMGQLEERIPLQTNFIGWNLLLLKSQSQILKSRYEEKQQATYEGMYLWRISNFSQVLGKTFLLRNLCSIFKRDNIYV